jgi:hypothetical protein
MDLNGDIENQRIFDPTMDRAIVSHRMVWDAGELEQYRSDGKRGGRPKSRKPIDELDNFPF